MSTPSSDSVSQAFDRPLRRPGGLRRLWSGPTIALRAAAHEGELLFARLRLIIVAAFSFIPVAYLLDGEVPVEGWLGALVIFVSLAVSWIFFRLASEQELKPWVSFASTFYDVTVLTVALGLYSWYADPLVATNSQFTWAIYLLTIAAAALRYDPRVCLWTGGWAIVQYALLVGLALSRLQILDRRVSPEYGTFSWQTQISRVILILATTYLTWVLVRRAGQLWRLSIRDSRTGLVNHSFFVDRLVEELDRARRHGEAAALAMLDVDRFKALNDRHGHAAGDLVLATVGKALRRNVRSHDLACRYGGDEFAVLLTGSTADDAAARMEALRLQLQDLSITAGDTSIDGIPLSIGVAAAPADGYDAQQLLTVADRRLYGAKEAGRGRLVSGTGA